MILNPNHQTCQRESRDDLANSRQGNAPVLCALNSLCSAIRGLIPGAGGRVGMYHGRLFSVGMGNTIKALQGCRVDEIMMIPLLRTGDVG